MCVSQNFNAPPPPPPDYRNLFITWSETSGHPGELLFALYGIIHDEVKKKQTKNKITITIVILILSTYKLIQEGHSKATLYYLNN